MRVFVYGTLKNGQPNHHWLSQTDNGYQAFLGQAASVNKFPLVIASRYNIPYLLDKPGTGHNIYGEVYEVDEKMLGKLDELEDHPTYYERRLEKVSMMEDKQEMTCWIYILKKHKEEMLQLPMLSSYRSEGDHGRPYVPRSAREDLTNYYSDVKSA